MDFGEQGIFLTPLIIEALPSRRQLACQEQVQPPPLMFD